MIATHGLLSADAPALLEESAIDQVLYSLRLHSYYFTFDISFLFFVNFLITQLIVFVMFVLKNMDL